MSAPVSARSNAKPRLADILDLLEGWYGRQRPVAPTDPYRFLLWWQCGYPPSEQRCSKGFDSLQREIGLGASELLAASRARLARVLKVGGMVPELRAARVREIVKRATEEFAGDLQSVLQRLPLDKARTALKRFPGIAAPGADRILLFAGIAPLAAVPSNCPHVLVRIESGAEPEQYTATYAQARAELAAQLPATLQARTRAYLLLQRHGQETCKRTRPRCPECPVAHACRFNQRAERRRSARPSRR
jgi:endonuclease III